MDFSVEINLTSSLTAIIFFFFIGTANNAGAILVLGRDLVVVPKLIHPLPPAITSPETSPKRHLEDTWMQVFLCHFGYVYNLSIYWCCLHI